MQRTDHICQKALAAVFLTFVMTGCQATMPTSSAGATGSDTTSSMFPLKFYQHAFDAHCYNTIRCKVIYNRFNFSPDHAETTLSPAPPSAEYRQHWSYASYAGIANFPPPAEVRWTSLDGVTHEAKVDIGAIFKDGRVLYRVADSEIPDRSWTEEPGIFLEVNDRTISVYMQAIIATKTEQIPGNKYSHRRDDVILAWSHTY